jgi:HEAT repeat protein
MKRRTLVALSAAVGVSVLGLLASSFHASRPAETSTASPGATTVVAPSTRPLPRAAAALGSRWVYTTDFTQTVTIRSDKAAKDPGSDIALVKRLRASWSVTCTAIDGDRLRYRATLEGVSLSANGEPQASDDVTHPFFFETTADGRLLSMAFDPAVGGDARGVLKSLVATNQLVYPKDGVSAASWLTEEQDPTGEYEARYTRDGDTQVRKTRVRYLRIATEQGLRPLQEVGKVEITDDAQFDLAPDGTLQAVASTTDTAMVLGEGMPRVRGVATLALRLVRASVDTTGLQAMNDEWSRQRKVGIASPPGQDDPRSKEAMQREADEGTLKKAALADLERDLAATPAGASLARSNQMARFQADFRLHPEDTQKAVRYVRSASIADGQAITGALGGAATPEALKALADIADSRGTPPEVRVNAIAALAINPTPSAASVQALKSMSTDSDPDIRAASTLGMGGAVRMLGGTDPATSDAAVAALVAGFNAAQSPQEKILYLRALGNTGDPRLLPLAEQAMGDALVDVRIAAASSVRFVAVDVADQILTRAMQTDADAAVRSQAIATVEGYRKLPGYLGIFGVVLRTEPDALVRRAVIHALNAVGANGEATALLRYAAENDPSADNRQMAKAILEAAGAVSQN